VHGLRAVEQIVERQVQQLRKDRDARVSQIEESLRAEYRQLQRKEQELRATIEEHKGRAADQSLKRVIDDMQQPNGIIGTPDGKTLYVADIRGRQTFAYDFNPDGTLTNKRLFCEFGSDGMTIDSEGNLYLTNNRAVQVFDKTGQRIETIAVPESPTNVAFGGKDRQLLFITARTSIYGVKTRVKGVGPQ